MPRVLNMRTDEIPSDAVYVGRPSKWGNPYKIDIGRLAAIKRFREYAIQRLEEEPHWLDELVDKDLVCWCVPLLCHADILLELANKGGRYGTDYW
ncbi:MAG: DUF4326 domain-containing protein [Candidatus Bipolaricaulis sp.]|nr:DUF4326 domain-containing protein [Candidatus Bipolaricaulis sp.]